MTHPFNILSDFLQRTEQEVGGREAATLSPEMRERLDRFSRGECSADERHALCEEMKHTPLFIDHLASSVRRRRAESPAEGAERQA
ncbi:MAG: hypothetical protein ACAI35_22210 [Candidatus Methylacidiphilales bacterium]|nr:hypothetical protein [Candidatus Methylacidiphilales bacterium]